MLYNMPARNADNGNTHTHTHTHTHPFNGPVFTEPRDSEWQPACSWAMCKSTVASCGVLRFSGTPYASLHLAPDR